MNLNWDSFHSHSNPSGIGRAPGGRFPAAGRSGRTRIDGRRYRRQPGTSTRHCEQSGHSGGIELAFCIFYGPHSSSQGNFYAATTDEDVLLDRMMFDFLFLDGHR